MKRFILTALPLIGFVISLSAQASITRFAVIDMSRVAAAFADQSTEAKAFNEKRDRVQAEIDKQNKELQELNSKLTEAQEEGKRDMERTLENQIRTKTQSLQTYIKNSFADLERERNRLLKNDTFMAQINTVIKSIAESEGCSMVLSKDGQGILWYSPSVDITNKVIERIRSGAQRR